MSLSQDLLRQYNKRKIDTPADTNTMGMARSYANPYDMLYEQFKDDKNFNVNTWQQSLKEGNEDTYLTFLERNKDQKLSDSFYDPSYYGYETQMLELSKAFADNTTKNKETLTTWDPRKNAWVENEVEMTERELIDYQLNRAQEQRTAEITKQIEQYRKDLMSTTSKVLHSGAATLAELGEGAASGVAGIIDFVVAIPAATIGAAGGENWLDAYVEYIGSQGLTALEQETLRASLDEYERTHTFFKDIDGNTTTAGMYFTGVANSIGRMIPAIAINYLTGGLASTVGFSLGTPAFYAGAYINNVYENVNNPATANSPAWMQVANAATKAAAEAVIEYALGEILGGTIQNRMLGMQGKASFTAGFGKMSGVKYFAKSALQEGLEEFLQDFSTNLVDQFTGMRYEGYEHTGVTFKTLVDSFTVGVISSLVMSGGAIARNAASSRYSDIQANRAQSFLSRAETEVENSERLTQKAQNAAERAVKSAGPVIEGENGELVKVKGAKRLAWSAMMSDINQALSDLKDGKGNLELSQEVYAAVTTLAEFYSSFDTTELKNIETLLQRVAKAEQTMQERKDRGIKIGGKTESAFTTDFQLKEARKTAVKEFSTKLYSEFTTMVGEVGRRNYSAKVKEAIESISEELTNAGVTRMTSATDQDGNIHTDSPELAAIDKKLQNKILAFSPEYSFVFTTNGHVAVETDDMLFVSEAWLENYTVSEIYHFLEQNKVLKNILANEQLRPMMKAIVKHNMQFTKQKAITSERALMDFLFNKSVYQNFLLSQNGKNLFEFKDFITRMHEVIRLMIQDRDVDVSKGIVFEKGKEFGLPSNISELMNRVNKIVYNRLVEIYGEERVVWDENGNPSVQAERDGDYAILYHGTKDKELKKTYIEGIKTRYENDVLFVSTVPEYSLGYGENLYEIRMPWEEYLKLDNAEVENDFDSGVSQEIWRQTEHAVQRVISNKLNKMPIITNITGQRSEFTQRFKELETLTDENVNVGEANKRINAIRKGELNKVYEQIKQTHREPTIKAILNWNINPQLIGADSILTEADRQMINQYQVLKNQKANAAKGGTLAGDYKRTVEVLRRDGGFNSLQNSILDRGLADNATDTERLYAIGLLNNADRRYQNGRDAIVQEEINDKAMNAYAAALNSGVEVSTFLDLARDTFVIEAEKFQNILALIETIRQSDNQLELITENIELFDEAFDRRQNKISMLLKGVDNLSPGTLSVPIGAFSEGVNSKSDLQFKMDVLNEFEKNFGISASQMYLGNLRGMTIEQRTRLEQEMESLKVTELSDFVTRKLENELGGDWVVTPVYRVDEAISNVNPNTGELGYDTVDAYKDLERIETLLTSLRGNIIKADHIKEITSSLTLISQLTQDKTLVSYVKNYVNKYVEQMNEGKRTPYEIFKYFERTLTKALKTSVDLMSKTIDLDTGIREWRRTPEVKDFQIVRAIPAEQMLKDSLVNPEIGSDQNQAFLDSFDRYPSNRFIPNKVEKFLKFEPKDSAGRRLANWTVKVINDPKRALGSTDYSGTEIKINIAYEQDLLDTFVHELNHALQYEYHMTRGFNDAVALEMPDFQRYILKNFPELVAYSFQKTGNSSTADMIRKMRDSEYLLRNPIIQARTAFVAYSLVQGEIWAEHYMHNGKLVKAFTMQQAPNGDSYIVSPDGKEKFKIPRTQILSKPLSSEKANETSAKTTQAENIAKRTFENILGVRQDGDVSEDVRDTYHAKLSRLSTIELTENILNSGLSVTTRAKATINDIITNPAAFLSQEMIDLAKSDDRTLTEGSIYHFLKEYFEQNFEGVSIDRDAVTHEYLFVDDNAFDDLLRIDTYNARNDKNKDLVKNTTLNGIYKSLELNRLGIPNDIPVIVSEDGVTQAVFNETYPNGAILIRTNSGMTNEKFINIVNHEFRHIMQRYNTFEGGFTTDFKVTSEMLADMKKHVPEIFKDKNLREAAKKAGLNPDVFIAQQFVYYLTGGEINAYGIRSYLLNMKPVYVEEKGGKFTIHMPWYNSKTGEGRYVTEFIAGRHDDDTKVELPRVKKKGQAKRETIRKDEAKDTNLKYFVEKGVQKQMDADLKKFIVATTGNEDKLPAELVHMIQKGKFTKQALFKWFRTVDTKDINQFTFDLINKTMFKNNVITDMKTLDQLVSSDVTMWWAASILFKREGLLDTTLLVENDAQKFIDFITSLENTEWKKKMFKIMETFDYYLVKNKKGETVRREIGVDQETADYIRVLAMQYFDGTLAGAFYTANTLRNVVREHQGRKHDREVGLAALTTKGTGKGKKARDTTFVGSSEIDAAGNDLLAIYNIDIMYKQEEDMITELGLWYKNQLEQEGLDLKEQMSKMLEFVTELKELSTDDIRARFVEMQNELLTGVESGTDIRDTSQDLGEPIRTNIVANLKSLGTRIANAVRDGKAVWTNLPKEVRDLFELKEYTRERKKVKSYELKAEAYSVGRGTVEGSTAFNYKRHDMTQIIANRDLLRQVLADINNNVFTNKEATKEIDKLRKRLDAKTRQQIRQGDEITRLKGEVRETAFRVDKRNKASDTPQHFTLVSNIDMPEVLRKLFDTGFTQMADTLVQFASKDEDGNLYDKSNPKFESRLKHEVNSWDAFYEANIDILSQLTRTEVLDIVEFIQGGVATIQGPTNKLAAFQIFTLGYIIDGARRNFNNWNFSEAELKLIEEVYERKASEYGSGVNAVGQMIKVINPFKKVQQRMLENYNITSTEMEPLFKAAEKLQKATTLKDRQEAGKEVATQLRILENLMRERDSGRSENIVSTNKKITDLQNQLSDATLQSLQKQLKTVQDKIDVILYQQKSEIEPLNKRVKQIEDELRELRLAGKNLDAKNTELAKFLDQIEDIKEKYKDELKQLNKEKSKLQRDKNYERLNDLTNEISSLEKQLKSQKFRKRTWYQKVKSWRFMSMLSRPTTWVRNLTSNVAVHSLNNSADFLASFVFGVLGKKAYRTGQWDLQGTKIDPKVKAFIDENIKTSELFNLLYDGSTKYDDRKKSAKEQKELFVTMIVEALERKYAAENRFDSKTMNRVAGFVNKMISDKPFIKLAATRYLGKILTLQKADLSNGFTNDILNSFAEAVILASEDYMHKRSFAADMVDSLKDKHPVAYEVLTFFQPFLNSSFNWFAESLKYNPIALGKAIFNATKLEERIAKLDARRAKGELVTSSRAAEAMIRRDIGKGIIGTLLLGLGIILSLNGIIRIDEDDEAFYVIIGDVKIDITSIFGSSSILVGASLAQVVNDDDDDDDDIDVMKYVATYFFEGFAIKDLLDQHRYDENFWEVLMTQMEGGLKSYTPQFVQLFVMALNNEKIRYSPGMKGVWERWLNSWVPAQPFGNRRINPYTGEVETKYSLPFFGNLLAAGILGPKMFITEMSEIEAFAREGGVNKTELTGELTVNGTKHQLDRETLNKKYGEMNKKSLAQITQKSHYVQMPDGTYKTLSWSKLSEAQRKNVIDRTMRENADLAKIYVWTQIMGKKYYGSGDLLKKLKSVGVTKNVYRGDKGFV